MKIAILSSFYCEWDGVSRVITDQTLEFISQGHEVAIFVQYSDMNPPEKVVLYSIGLPHSDFLVAFNNILFPLDLLRLVRWGALLGKYDIIYAHRYPMTWLAFYTKKIHGKKYIYYHHHFNPPKAFSRLTERLYASLRYPIEKSIASKADSAISISQYSHTQLMKETGLDSTVIYNKIDTKRFHPGIDGSVVRKRFDLGNNPVILYLGQISPTKGAYLLISAFNLVLREIPNAYLIMAGKQPYRNHMAKLRALANRSVIFTGVVADDEVPLFYGACNVYATASLWEGFNIPVVEAQACGRSVVAFNIGPHPEVISNSEKSKLVPPGDIEAFAASIITFLKN
jgi:glycosyltransferase involved in cell wall biosynthesis